MWALNWFKIVPFAGLVCFAPLTVWAEQKFPAPANNAQQGDPVSAAEAAEARKVALLKRYIAATQLDEVYGTTFNSMLPRILEEYRKQQPDMTDDDINIIKETFSEGAAEFTPLLIDELTKTFVDLLTEDELRGVVEFYETPTGRALNRNATNSVSKYVDGNIIKNAFSEGAVEFNVQLVDDLTKSSMDMLTEDELKRVMEFYETPAGRALARNATNFISKYTETVNTLAPKLAARMQEIYCKKVECEE